MVQEDRLTFIVSEAQGKDAGRGVARIDSSYFSDLGVEIGDVIIIAGNKKTVARILPDNQKKEENEREKTIKIDGIIRKNASVGLGEKVEACKSQVKPAKKLKLVSAQEVSAISQDTLLKKLQNLPVMKNDNLRISLFGGGYRTFKVANVKPEDPVIISPETEINVLKNKKDSKNKHQQEAQVTYEDIGGLNKQIRRIKEMIELPLRYPELFDQLGIDPPKGVLLHGTPGTGKTLIARAVANETDACFFSISGPEVIQKYYGESEAQIRQIFDKATKKAPSIIFLDELDAIAPKRSEATGDVEKRVVAQLLTLMDGLKRRGQVIVIGATNMVDSIDSALRRPGRFDREITIDVPDRSGREEILNIHTRDMKLEEDVNIEKLAELTHGFVGADIEALVRESAMHALRESLPQEGFHIKDRLYSDLLNLKVSHQNFLQVLPKVQPSALREFIVEVPQVGWEDVGGLNDVKQSLLEAVEWPLKYSDLFERASAKPPKGILLYGLPGTGKTLLARACAGESDANFIAVKSPALFSKWVGKTEEAIRTVFKKAKQAAPCILFFDEIESLTAQRGLGEQDAGVKERAISQFLNEFDGIEELKDVLVIGATNRKDLLDPAVLRAGRFDFQFELTPPTLEERQEIFLVHTRNQPLTENIDVEEMAERTKGFVGADIEAVCQEAAMQAIRNFLDQAEAPNLEEFIISRQDFLKVIEKRKNMLKKKQKED